MPPTAHPSRPAPTAKPAAMPKGDAPAGADRAAPKPASGGALFRALVDAGSDPEVAYTADQQTQLMMQGLITAQLEPLIARIERRFDEQDRKLDALAEAVAGHDRRLDILAAQMRLVIGALGVLVTVLIAVFGFLLTNTPG